MFWWKSRPGELSYNSSISNNLAEMINFPIQIPAWDSHILTLELFLSFDTSICSAPSIWNPLFSINFHSNSKGEGGGWSFPLQSFWLYSCWFRWFSWSSKRRISLIILVLLLLLPNFVRRFKLELMFVYLTESIRTSLIQLLVLLPLLIELTFLNLYQQHKSPVSKAKYQKPILDRLVIVTSLSLLYLKRKSCLLKYLNNFNFDDLSISETALHSCKFPDCWEILSVVPVFLRMLGHNGQTIFTSTI